MQPIRILVADDHALLRAALRVVFEREPGLVVAGEVDSGEAAVEAALGLRPDVVVMDLCMPGCGGLEATRVISATTGARVLVLSLQPEEEGMLPALRAGASGYLAKTASPDELIGSVRRVARGELALSPSGLRVLIAAVISGRAAAGRRNPARAPSGMPREPAGSGRPSPTRV
jgi:DNA-binding NarL/FixJ family response regulator